MDALGEAGADGARRGELDDAAGGVAPATMRRRLAALVEDGVIERLGTGRGTRYRLAEHGGADQDHDQGQAERAERAGGWFGEPVGEEGQAVAGGPGDELAGDQVGDQVGGAPMAPRTGPPPEDEVRARASRGTGRRPAVPRPRVMGSGEADDLGDADDDAGGRARRSGPRILPPGRSSSSSSSSSPAPAAPAESAHLTRDTDYQDDRQDAGGGTGRRRGASGAAGEDRVRPRILPPRGVGDDDGSAGPRRRDRATGRAGGRAGGRDGDRRGLAALLPDGLVLGSGRSGRGLSGTGAVATVAVVLVVLGLLNGAMVLLWRSVGPAVTVSIVLAGLGAIAAMLRRRRDRLLSWLVVWAEVIAGIAVALGMWAWVADWWHTAGEDASPDRTRNAVVLAIAVAIGLYGATGAPAWYWLVGRRGRARMVRAAAVALSCVLVAAGGVSWSIWQGTGGFGTHSQKTASWVIYDWVHLLTGYNAGHGYVRAFDQFDAAHPNKIPPALAPLTCTDPAGQREIMQTLWPYRQGEIDTGGSYDWNGYPNSEAPKGKRTADIPTSVEGWFALHSGGGTQMGFSTWVFHMVHQRGPTGDEGWTVCGLRKTKPWDSE